MKALTWQGVDRLEDSIARTELYDTFQKKADGCIKVVLKPQSWSPICLSLQTCLL